MKYEIKKGETIFKIWRRDYINDYSFQEFKEYLYKNNPGLDINKINTDQIIFVPDIKFKTNEQNKKSKKIVYLIITSLVLVGSYMYFKR